MDWWDSLDSGDYSSFGDYSGDAGSFNPSDYAFSGAPLSFGVQPLDYGMAGAGLPGENGLSFGGGVLGAPGAATPMAAPGGSAGFSLGGGRLQDPTQPYNGGQNGLVPTQQNSGILGALGSPNGIAAMLGLGGSIGGLIGQIAGGGKGTQQTINRTPTLTPQAQNQVTQSYQALTPIAQGISPLQQQQNSLLAALANGQGLPPGYAQLIEQAFQPQMGDIYTQAVNAGRSRGFYDAPGTSPAGSNVLGPALSNLQGQMAQAKLGLMQSLPGVYNTPIANQSQAASNLSNSLLNGANFGAGINQQGGSQQNQAAALGQMGGLALQGIGQTISQNQQNIQQQQNFDRMMNAYNQNQINLSGTRQ